MMRCRQPLQLQMLPENGTTERLRCAQVTGNHASGQSAGQTAATLPAGCTLPGRDDLSVLAGRPTGHGTGSRCSQASSRAGRAAC